VYVSNAEREEPVRNSIALENIYAYTNATTCRNVKSDSLSLTWTKDDPSTDSIVALEYFLSGGFVKSINVHKNTVERTDR